MAAEVRRTEVSYPVVPIQVEEYDWTLQRLYCTHGSSLSTHPDRHWKSTLWCQRRLGVSIKASYLCRLTCQAGSTE